MDAQQQAAMAGYVTLRDWVAQHGRPFFETKSSLDWFVRNNLRELIQTEALIRREGRAGSLVHLEKFPLVVVAIFKRRALEKTAQAA